ncbi:MAG: ABC transporter ATP-binding protein [Alphaproteobacteria bacterium]|nr:ABC transporter ATP-binding protein [Alphaproteobacteria bacterium]
MTNIALELQNISKSYIQPGLEIKVLNNVNLSIEKGEFTGLVGPSGCGKTTLLQIAGLLDDADSGDVIIAGSKLEKNNDKSKTYLRGHKIGFVYQFHNLLKDFSAIENVAMPLIINFNYSKNDAFTKAKSLLEMLELPHRASHYPNQLSGGEQQRVAIARALIHSPDLILADEPTGNLDPETADHVFKLMKNTVKEMGLAALIVTHNNSLLSSFDRKFQIKLGEFKQI